MSVTPPNRQEYEMVNLNEPVSNENHPDLRPLVHQQPMSTARIIYTTINPVRILTGMGTSALLYGSGGEALGANEDLRHYNQFQFLGIACMTLALAISKVENHLRPKNENPVLHHELSSLRSEVEALRDQLFNTHRESLSNEENV